MLSKAELIKRSRYYFDNKEVNVMYATEDGNFFYENSKSYADSHAKSKKMEVIVIRREDLVEQKPKSEKTTTDKKSSKESNDSELDQLRKEAKSLKIRGYAIMKAPALKKKIAEANGSE